MNRPNTELDSLLQQAGAVRCDELMRKRPRWVTGQISDSDARFLMASALNVRSELATEIGTASGYSTAVLACSLQLLAEQGAISPNFCVTSFDISSQFYADRSKRVGDAARELLSPDLLSHIEFVHPATAWDVGQRYHENELRLLFIDADHRHPWPTLDLVAVLDVLRPGASVVLHDINLPVIHPQFQDWGVKYLFDAIDAEKATPNEIAIPNIGRIVVPGNKQRLRNELLQILYAHPWQVQVPPGQLQRLKIAPP